MGGMSYTSEKPVHTVTLSAFRMAATPVTVAVWKEYCKATSTPLPKEPSWGFIDDHPVIYVSWNDIMGIDGKGGFCAWATELAGIKLMLPTELLEQIHFGFPVHKRPPDPVAGTVR